MYNEFTEGLMADYPATMAILIYEQGNDYYLESHDIVAGQIMEGKPLKEETIFGIAELFNEKGISKTNISGIFPTRLLHFEALDGNNYNMIWWSPIHTRVMHFTENLCIPDGVAWVPPLVFQVKNKNLIVLALSSDNRPDLDTQLMAAPFHNTSKGGNVCLGSANAKKETGKKTYQSEMNYWEEMFWNSKFSHLAGSENPTKSNLSLIWKEQINAARHFPMEELQPTKLTLKKLL